MLVSLGADFKHVLIFIPIPVEMIQFDMHIFEISIPQMRETNKVRILRARVFLHTRGKKLQLITVSILSWVSVKQVRSGRSKVDGIIMNRNLCKITL